jgi:hypothetical protein
MASVSAKATLTRSASGITWCPAGDGRRECGGRFSLITRKF